MQFRIFNNTQTVTIDDNIVNRINQRSFIPMDIMGIEKIEIELAILGITEETNAPVHQINTAIKRH